MNRWLLPAATILIMSLAFVTRPKTMESPTTTVSFATEIHPIITQRCTPCHAVKATWPGMVGPQGGILLETPEQMQAQAQNILKNAVHTKYMPLGNLTKITDEERSKLATWILSGAQIDDDRTNQ